MRACTKVKALGDGAETRSPAPAPRSSDAKADTLHKDSPESSFHSPDQEATGTRSEENIRKAAH